MPGLKVTLHLLPWMSTRGLQQDPPEYLAPIHHQAWWLWQMPFIFILLSKREGSFSSGHQARHHEMMMVSKHIVVLHQSKIYNQSYNISTFWLLDRHFNLCTIFLHNLTIKTWPSKNSPLHLFYHYNNTLNKTFLCVSTICVTWLIITLNIVIVFNEMCKLYDS